MRLALDAFAKAYLHSERARSPNELLSERAYPGDRECVARPELVDVFHRLGLAVVAAERFDDAQRAHSEDSLRSLAQSTREWPPEDVAAFARSADEQREARANAREHRPSIRSVLRSTGWPC